MHAFPKVPYERMNSMPFLDTIKMNDITQAFYFLQDNRFHVHDFDYVNNVAI
jgi:hypothetical protein